MFDVFRKEIEWGGRKLVLESGKIARQADGAVLATYGDTSVLCTAVAEKESKQGIDFFPLTVHYQEKTFAAGKIPGGFFKREGRPSEKEILSSRLIDRPVRPLFHPRFCNETQVICTVVGHDLENDPDIVALVGASAALTISGGKDLCRRQDPRRFFQTRRPPVGEGDPFLAPDRPARSPPFPPAVLQ